MGQNNIPGQSTDQLPGDTNPNQPKIIYRGTATLPITTAQSTGYTGGVTIDIQDVAGGIANPMADVWIQETLSGSGQTVLTKCNFARSDTSGNLSFATDYYLALYTPSVGSSVLRLSINLTGYKRTSPATYTVNYVIWSGSISQSSILT